MEYIPFIGRVKAHYKVNEEPKWVDCVAIRFSGDRRNVHGMWYVTIRGGVLDARNVVEVRTR